MGNNGLSIAELRIKKNKKIKNLFN